MPLNVLLKLIEIYSVWFVDTIHAEKKLLEMSFV